MYTAKSVIACLGVSVGANCRTMGFFKQNQTGDGANELAVAQHHTTPGPKPGTPDISSNGRNCWKDFTDNVRLFFLFVPLTIRGS